jgi:hypothetical protein
MKQAMTLKQLFLLMLVVGGAIQFIPVDRTNPPVDTRSVGSEPVMKLFRNACFDCHSNETVWPWYGKVAPFSWLVARDVNKGREALNFSNWSRMPLREQEEMMDKVWKKFFNDTATTEIYTLGRPEGHVTTDHHRMLRVWAGLPPE